MKENTRSLQTLALKFYETESHADFTLLYNNLYPKIKSFVVTRYLKYPDWSPDEVGDVLSETFTKIYRKIKTYDPYYQFSTWAYTIAKNESLKLIAERNKKNESGMEMLGNDAGISSCSPSISGEFVMSKVLRECVNDYMHIPNYDDILGFDKSDHIVNCIIEEIEALPEKYSKVLIEREVNDMSYQDIADKHDLNLNTVKVHIHKGRKILQRKLKKVYAEWKNSNN